MNSYIFTSERLGFRNWVAADIPKMVKINASQEVMQHFPSTATAQQTADFIKRMQIQYTEKGYCYFAVDRLSDGNFIGFIGLSYQTFEADFTPCVDVGWRLDSAYWGNGYATEGARASLKYGFDFLKIKNIKALCPVVNLPSENVMKKIGMQKLNHFKHSKLGDFPVLEECVLYEIEEK
ncbi:MAG: GNAT family N-acetyltransferase [Saprospiraceae bacterium]